jgi:hypothetical protein
MSLLRKTRPSMRNMPSSKRYENDYYSCVHMPLISEKQPYPKKDYCQET